MTRRRVVNQPYIKRRSKLTKVPVPEMFFQYHLVNIPKGQSILVDRLRLTKPTRRGKGFSRVLKNLTEGEWEDLYALSVWGRSRIRGAERGPELYGAVCAGAIAKRMEALGVATPIPYESPVAYKTRKRNNKIRHTDIPAVAKSPITIDIHDPSTPVKDLNGVSDEELQQFMEDMGLGKKTA